MSKEQNYEQARVLREEELKGVNGGLYVDKMTGAKSEYGTGQWAPGMGSEKLSAGLCPGFVLQDVVLIGDTLPIVGLT